MDWKTITSNWGFNYAFGASVFIGLVMTYWSSRKPVSRLAYNTRDSTIVSETNPNYSSSITVTFNGREIPRATLSQISIWNDGNQSLRRSDITSKKPLKISVPSGQHILQSAVKHVADEAMNVEIAKGDDGTLEFTFEYMDAGQGIICDVLHTGTEGDLSFSGVLVGAKSPVKLPLPTQTLSNRMFAFIMIMGTGIPLACFVIVPKLIPAEWGMGWRMSVILVLVIGTVSWMFALMAGALYRGLQRVNFGKVGHGLS